ncbi:MAG: ethanolamine ammonia-lyase reactivating factor EutA [Candidatus Thorarchaeota archaeon]|jgi:ethanolamine utilization protein EutA
MRIKTHQKLLTSVGVDIGTSTSHVVFSSILLERDLKSRTEKFEIKEKKVLHKGPIHFTPFSDPHTIDFGALRKLILADYANAGFDLAQIDTGAVIITGETARKENAEEIVAALAGETGKFVAATAGPNFESVLAAHGAGAVIRSAETGLTIMNVDIGGGSSNIAVCRDGKVIATAAINVGGRLVATDETGTIIRLEETGKRLGEKVGLDLQLGQDLDSPTKHLLGQALADSLIQAIEGKNESEITEMLMMTPTLDFQEKVDEVMFSGGVAEFIYGLETSDYNDLGLILAQSIVHLVDRHEIPMTEPEHRIRATVIGAGQSSLQVSGSTTFLSSGLEYPLRNLPVITPHVPKGKTSFNKVRDAIQNALKRFDIEEGTDPLILAFADAVRPSYESLTVFAKGIVSGLPKTVANGTPILMCFDTDIGNSVGNVMKRETGVVNEILSIDEISLHEGDFVDIGEPIIENVVVPVVVKTLVFEEK